MSPPFFKRFYFIFRQRGREGEREGEKHQCVVVAHTPPSGDLACNPGLCPDWNPNGDPLVLRPALNPLSNSSQGYNYNFKLQGNVTGKKRGNQFFLIFGTRKNTFKDLLSSLFLSVFHISLTFWQFFIPPKTHRDYTNSPITWYIHDFTNIIYFLLLRCYLFLCFPGKHLGIF